MGITNLKVVTGPDCVPIMSLLVLDITLTHVHHTILIIDNRRVDGDVPIYLKFALKVTHPRQKTPISTDFA